MKVSSPASTGPSKKGFTLVEVLIVVSIMGIIAVMAIPSFVQWQQNLNYRKAAMSALSVLRQARNLAITTNKEQQVAFDPAAHSFGIQQGNRANNADFTGAAVNWQTTIPSTVITSPITTIQFAPNGTASFGGASYTTATVQIQDTSGAARYLVVVTQVGRISVTSP